MATINLDQEIFFKTMRSGGRGGQNVNKVETAVEGYFDIAGSAMLSDWQKRLAFQNLAHRINKNGLLAIRSERERSQLRNKQDVVARINILVSNALVRRKKRIETTPTASSKQKRLQHKKDKSDQKKDRKKIRPSQYPADF